MPEMPVDKTNYDAETIPVNAVRSGDPLLFDRGEGDQLFVVENVSFHHKRDGQGGGTTTYTLTSGPVAGGGEPWVIELPGGAPVIRVLGKSKYQP